MAAGELRAEVDQAVATIDLDASQREAVRLAGVRSRLAGRRPAEAGVGCKLLLSLAEQPRGVAERLDLVVQPGLELPLRFTDLERGVRVVEEEQIRVRDRMSSEDERACAIQLRDQVPVEDGRLAFVPREPRAPVDDARRDEDGRSKSVPLELRDGVLIDVAVAIVEAERDHSLDGLAGVDQPHRVLDADAPITLVGE